MLSSVQYLVTDLKFIFVGKIFCVDPNIRPDIVFSAKLCNQLGAAVGIILDTVGVILGIVVGICTW